MELLLKIGVNIRLEEDGIYSGASRSACLYCPRILSAHCDQTVWGAQRH